MPLADEMLFQRIETLLDMKFKKIHEELKRVQDELAVFKAEFEKHAKAARAAPAPEQQWQQAPQQWQQQAPQQQQWQQAPQQNYAQQANRYSGQFDATSAPQQGPPQQAPQAQQRNKWAPPPDRPPETQPIDRNGVAPSDVTIEKFFYMGNKKTK